MQVLADRALIDERDGASRKCFLGLGTLGDVPELLCVVLYNSNAQKTITCMHSRNCSRDIVLKASKE